MGFKGVLVLNKKKIKRQMKSERNLRKNFAKDSASLARKLNYWGVERFLKAK